MEKEKIFDSHIHFNDTHKYNDSMIDYLIKNGTTNNVGGFLCASFDLESSKKSIKIAKKYPNVVFSGIAIHPNDVENFNESVFEDLERLVTEKEVVCIGETGLDYFYSIDFKEKQKDFFIRHIALANKHDKTLQVHIRDQKDRYDAYYDVIEILKLHPCKRVIIHCFSGNSEIAQLFVKMGFYINIGGAITFNNAKVLQEVLNYIPLDLMLVETDAPYLAPHPHRGKLNEPKFINLTVEKIAELKNISKNKVIEATTQNALKVFKIN